MDGGRTTHLFGRRVLNTIPCMEQERLLNTFHNNGRRPTTGCDPDIPALEHGNLDDLDLSSLPSDQEQIPLRIAISFPPSRVYRFETIKRSKDCIELIPPDPRNRRLK